MHWRGSALGSLYTREALVPGYRPLANYCQVMPMKRFLLWFIRFYQKQISPCTPPSCNFMPTCSRYAYEAINKYGSLKGTWLALRRLLRCHPFYKGDYYDPVP